MFLVAEFSKHYCCCPQSASFQNYRSVRNNHWHYSHSRPMCSRVCASVRPAAAATGLLLWARQRCRISPPRFLAECCKRQLNQVSSVLLYFRLSAFSDLYWVCLSVFSCTVLFVSISQVIGCEDRLRNDLYCVGWGVKLYSNQTKFCYILQISCFDNSVISAQNPSIIFVPFSGDLWLRLSLIFQWI